MAISGTAMAPLISSSPWARLWKLSPSFIPSSSISNIFFVTMTAWLQGFKSGFYELWFWQFEHSYRILWHYNVCRGCYRYIGISRLCIISSCGDILTARKGWSRHCARVMRRVESIWSIWRSKSRSSSLAKSPRLISIYSATSTAERL